MSLIKCPECGNTISDKAPACPHCGILKEDIQAMLQEVESPATSNVEKSQDIRCLYCGAIIENTSSNCPKCNHPVLCFSNDANRVKKTLEQNNNSEDSKEVFSDINIADEETAKLSVRVMNMAGTDGPVVIKKSEDGNASIRLTNAMMLDRGLIYEERSTTQKNDVVITSPDVLIIDRKITKTAEIFDLLEGIRNQGSGMLIIADDISGQALNSVEHYRERWNLDLAAIRAPGYGDRRKAIMRDIATVTGGSIFSDDYRYSITYRNALDRMGHAEYIKVGQDKTLIVGGYGKQSEINDRIAEIKRLYEASSSDFDKEKMQERVNNLLLRGAVVDIGVNGNYALADISKRIEEKMEGELVDVINSLCV